MVSKKKKTNIDKNYYLQDDKRSVAVIYAGGRGTRLWPVSTEVHPKQINPLFTGKILLEEAYERCRKLFPKDRIIVVITEQLHKKVKKIVDLPKKNYVIQPDNMDTAVAMGLTALYVESLFPDSTAVTIYSDHFISSVKTYLKTIKQAIRVAQKKPVLVTIGTKPTFANTQFGYIKLGRRFDSKTRLKRVYKVEKFTEKPNKKKAEKMLKSGKYVWNTGMYVWNVRTLLSAFKEHQPDIYEGLVELRTEFFGPDYQKELNDWYQSVEAESFDKAISEKAKDLVVLVSNHHWKDIGNWQSVYDIADKREDGLAVLHGQGSKVVSVDSENCLVVPGQKIVSLVGVKDLMVVQTKDELLICKKGHEGKVKKVAKLIQREELDDDLVVL